MSAGPERALVVVADDDPDVRELVVMLLRRAHYQVLEAPDGERALELIQARRPGLVVLDVKMPGLGGYELTRRLKADAETREIPVLLLSASVREHEIDLGFRAGADDFLGKPFAAAEFARRVAALLSGERPLGRRARPESS